jgi:hypothetical protein
MHGVAKPCRYVCGLKVCTRSFAQEFCCLFELYFSRKDNRWPPPVKDQPTVFPELGSTEGSSKFTLYCHLTVLVGLRPISLPLSEINV